MAAISCRAVSSLTTKSGKTRDDFGIGPLVCQSCTSEAHVWMDVQLLTGELHWDQDESIPEEFYGYS